MPRKKSSLATSRKNHKKFRICPKLLFKTTCHKQPPAKSAPRQPSESNPKAKALCPQTPLKTFPWLRPLSLGCEGCGSQRCPPSPQGWRPASPSPLLCTYVPGVLLEDGVPPTGGASLPSLPRPLDSLDPRFPFTGDV